MMKIFILLVITMIHNDKHSNTYNNDNIHTTNKHNDNNITNDDDDDDDDDAAARVAEKSGGLSSPSHLCCHSSLKALEDR